jgi:hypothetical protein
LCLSQSDYVPHDPSRVLSRTLRQQNFNILSSCFGSTFRDGSLGLRHIDKGLYADQFDRWFQNFHRSQFLVLSYEQWLSDPLKYYETILNFFGQDLFDSPPDTATALSAPSVSIRRRAGRGAGRGGERRIKTGFSSKEEITFLSKNYLTTENEKKTRFSESLMRELECYYQRHNQQVNEMLGQTVLRVVNISCEEYETAAERGTGGEGER